MTTTTINTANATATISANDINAALTTRPYIILLKNDIRIFSADADITFNGDAKDLFNGSGEIMSTDGAYKMMNIILTSSVSAKELKKTNRRYRTFDKSGMNSTVIGADRPMDIALAKAGMTEDDIISVNISDIFAQAIVAKDAGAALQNAKMINIAANTYGIRIYNEKLYVAMNGWVKGSAIIEMYDIEDTKPITDNTIKRGLVASKVYMPSVRTSSMKNAGEKFFVADGHVDNFERALCAGVSLRDRFDMLSKNGLLSVSLKKANKEWKYLPSSLAGRTKLDLSHCRIAVIDEKGRVGDGNGSANPDLVGIENRTALQMRVRTYQGKGVLMCEHATFEMDYAYIQALDESKITYYGDPSLPVGVIVDRNFIKMLDARLDILPEEERFSWIIHEFGEVSKSEMSIDECAKWLRRCKTQEDKDFIMNKFISGFAKTLFEKTVDCFTPDDNGSYLPSLLRGIDKLSTAKQLNSMFGKLWSADCRPKAWMGGYTLGLTQHPIFNEDGMKYRTERNKDDLAVVFVNSKTFELIDKAVEVALTKFPSPSERGAVCVAVRINEHVCDGCIGMDMSEESMALLEALSGADCDGDKTNVMPTTIRRGDKNVRTWLGKILTNAGYRHLCIHNVLPEIADNATVDSITEMHIRDINSQAGMTGVMVSAMNIIKLNASCISSGEEYVGHFENISEFSIDDIRKWINTIAVVGQQFTMKVKINDANRRAWEIDCGIVQDWLAEFTTGLSGSGVAMPEDIRNFFCRFKNEIVSYWYEKLKNTDKRMDKDILTRRLTIGNGELYNRVEAVIAENEAYARKRMSEINWVSDNASTVEEFAKANTDLDMSQQTIYFGYVGNYMPGDLKKTSGFGLISTASHNLGDSRVWKYWVGIFHAALNNKRVKSENNGTYEIRTARVNELCKAAWMQSKYSTLFMVDKYVKEIGYNVTDDVASTYEDEYKDKIALPLFVYTNKGENDYTAALKGIKNGNIATGTIRNGKLDIKLAISDGKDKNVGIKISTNPDILINGLDLHIDQVVDAKTTDSYVCTVVLCTIL